MPYAIIWSPTARRKLADGLPAKVADAVWEFANGALAQEPRRVGKPLRRDLHGLWSARRGDYRVIYRIDEAAGTIVIVTAAHRGAAHRGDVDRT
jgi:mRNA-degrading endonuclease RelE of RelBE toxin-antitoxin system